MSAPDAAEPELQRANLPTDMTPDELTIEVAEKLFATPQEGRVLGVDLLTGNEIVVKEGRFGPYVTEILPEQADDDGDGDVDAPVPTVPAGLTPRDGGELSTTLDLPRRCRLMRRRSPSTVMGPSRPRRSRRRKPKKAAKKRRPQAAHRLAVQADGHRDGDVGGRAAPAVAAARRRRRPCQRRGDHRAERPVRPVSEEGRGLTVVGHRGAASRSRWTRRCGSPSPSAPRPGRCRAGVARTGAGLGQREADGHQGRPLRSVCDRFGETNASLRKGDDVASITPSGRWSCSPTAVRGPAKKAAKKTTKKAAAKKAPAKKAPAKKAAAKKAAAKKA